MLLFAAAPAACQLLPLLEKALEGYTHWQVSTDLTITEADSSKQTFRSKFSP